MTDAGRAVLSKMGIRSFKIDSVVERVKEERVWTKFNRFPGLYKRIRASNIAFYKKRDPEIFEKKAKSFNR